ncbi:MAG: hypothetical protein ABI136_06495 [Ginsengibacter sp.]
MKWIFLLSGIMIFSSCDLRHREVEVKKKLDEISRREQELGIKEQMLEIKELQLSERQKILDSTTNIVNDSIFREHLKTQGLWRVDMQCSETNCAGSAVGDVKSEQWNIKVENDQVIINARSNKSVVKTYTGSYVGNVIKLTAEQDSTEANAKIYVSLQKISDKEMGGERQVIQATGCRIVYSLRLKKE